MSKNQKILLGAVAALVAFGMGKLAFSQAPSELAGCVYNATPPTLSDKQTVVIQCDVNGKIITH